MYADNATVTYSAEDIETLCNDLNEELAITSEWIRSNKFSLNAGKYEFLIVDHKRLFAPFRSCHTLRYSSQPHLLLRKRHCILSL